MAKYKGKDKFHKRTRATVKVHERLLKSELTHKKNSEQEMNELPSEIFRHWVHSREEDTEDVKVFRPHGYDFPPSRGRMGFEVKKNGEFVQYDIGPACGTEKVEGCWEAEGTDTIIVYLEDPSRRSFTLNIESCDKDILRIRK